MGFPLKLLPKTLYLQVVIGVALGVTVGLLWPEIGVTLKPLGDGFIKLVKMLIAPIVFLTVTVGIARMEDMHKVGRVGIKALIYFELVTTLALGIGLLVVNLLRPGTGMNVDPKTLDAGAISTYASGAKALNSVDFLLNIIPSSAVDAFAKGEILQVLLFSVLFGWALGAQSERGRPVVELLERLSSTLFKMVDAIMKLAPLGAFGAMGFTIGKFGMAALFSLGMLLASVYLTCALFVVLVLGTIARLNGFSLWRLILHIREEILLVLGTSSSESALPRMMEKMESFGCARPVVGLVIPTGYSFNLDGTSIYLTMAAVFISQALNIELSLVQQLTLLTVLLLTSKGAAAVTGGGFITLAATLSSLDSLPVAGLALLLGVDRFMSEARAITNLIGNAVATVVIAKWEGAFHGRDGR
ncbi:MAG: dicarboxylate/amino acid:cation symporter [Methylococcaceae bacterium]|nr:dicarboxylate/amino acid:cation symporter [Methylococcaceae bacterium]